MRLSSFPEIQASPTLLPASDVLSKPPKVLANSGLDSSVSVSERVAGVSSSSSSPATFSGQVVRPARSYTLVRYVCGRSASLRLLSQLSDEMHKGMTLLLEAKLLFYHSALQRVQRARYGMCFDDFAYEYSQAYHFRRHVHCNSFNRLKSIAVRNNVEG